MYCRTEWLFYKNTGGESKIISKGVRFDQRRCLYVTQLPGNVKNLNSQSEQIKLPYLLD